MKEILESLKNKLSTHNFKLTSQREDILKILIKNKNRHFSAESLFAEVKKINPDVGLATIYRNLELFCKLGITHQLDFDSSHKYYELDLEGTHHHHLICVNCNRIIEFNDDALEEFEKELEKSYDFKIADHKIKFFGLCSECKGLKD